MELTIPFSIIKKLLKIVSSTYKTEVSLHTKCIKNIISIVEKKMFFQSTNLFLPITDLDNFGKKRNNLLKQYFEDIFNHVHVYQKHILILNINSD